MALTAVVFLVTAGVLALGTACVNAAGIGVDATGLTLDLGQLSPARSPYLFPMSTQLLVSSPGEPWYLSVSSDTAFRNSGGEAVLSAECLEWAVNGGARPVQWHSFGTDQLIASSADPTPPEGALVALDYRIQVGWDAPPTREPISLDVEFTASASADLYPSSVYPNPFRLDQGENVTIGFYLPGTGMQEVQLRIMTLASEPVYICTKTMPAGQWQTFTWNGESEGGVQVGAGQYQYSVNSDGTVLAAGTITAEFPRTGSSRLSGLVTDDESGEPIPRAVVKLYNSKYRLCQTTKTDKAGRYELAWLAPDAYFLVVSCPLYYPVETEWVMLGPWQSQQLDVKLVHNRSLVVQDFTLPQSWPVGQLGEISFVVSNPGTGVVLSAKAQLEVPAWVKLLPKTIQREGTADRQTGGLGEATVASHSQMQIPLGRIEPGQSVKVIILAHALPGAAGVTGQAVVQASGVAENEKVQSPPVIKQVSVVAGALGPLRPGHRLWVNSQWHDSAQKWSGGVHLEYPVGAGFTLAERSYLRWQHGTGGGENTSDTLVGGSGECLLQLTPLAMKLGDTQLEAAGWFGKPDTFTVGIGEQELRTHPAGSSGLSAAGFHSVALLPTGEVRLSLGSPSRITHQERWDVDQIIRSVHLKRAPDDARGVRVLLEWSDGRWQELDRQRYYVSIMQRQIVFLQPLIPGELQRSAPEQSDLLTESTPDLVVEYQTAWRPGDDVTMWETGIKSELSRGSAQMGFLQVPGDANEPNRWLTLGVDNAKAPTTCTYDARISFQAAGSSSGQSGGTLQKVTDHSAVEMTLSWQPSTRGLLQLAGYHAGKQYQAPGEVSEKAAAKWELNSEALVGSYVLLQTDASRSTWYPEKRKVEQNLGAQVTYAPPGLPEVTAKVLQIERKGDDAERERRLAGTVSGSTGPVTWTLDGQLSRGVPNEGKQWAGGRVGFGLDYAVTDWATAGVSYRRELRETDGLSAREQESEDAALNSLTVSDTMEVGVRVRGSSVSGYITGSWKWQAEDAKQRAQLERNRGLDRNVTTQALELGLEGKARPGVGWQAGLLRRKGHHENLNSETALHGSVNWGKPEIGLVGSLQWYRQLRGASLADEEIEELVSLQPSLMSGSTSAQNVLRVQIDSPLPEHPGGQITGEVCTARYLGASQTAQTHSVGVELSIPWRERWDISVGLGAHQSVRGETRVVTTQVGAAAMYHLSEAWLLRAEASRALVSDFPSLSTVSAGIGWRPWPQASLFAGVSWSDNRDKIGGEDRLSPYLQVFVGEIPRKLLHNRQYTR